MICLFIGQCGLDVVCPPTICYFIGNGSLCSRCSNNTANPNVLWILKPNRMFNCLKLNVVTSDWNECYSKCSCSLFISERVHNKFSFSSTFHVNKLNDHPNIQIFQKELSLANVILSLLLPTFNSSAGEGDHIQLSQMQKMLFQWKRALLNWMGGWCMYIQWPICIHCMAFSCHAWINRFVWTLWTLSTGHLVVEMNISTNVPTIGREEKKNVSTKFCKELIHFGNWSQWIVSFMWCGWLRFIQNTKWRNWCLQHVYAFQNLFFILIVFKWMGENRIGDLVSFWCDYHE